jgi:hypothetical protein
MCIKKYIETIIEDYIDSHPHPIESHTHENYIDEKDLGYVFFANKDNIIWNTSVSGVSTSIYLSLKTN